MKGWLPVQTFFTYLILGLAFYSLVDPISSQIVLVYILLLSAPLTFIMSAHAAYLKAADGKILMFINLLPGVGSAIHLSQGILGPVFSSNFFDVIQMACFDLEMILLSLTIGKKINRERSHLKKSMERAYNELQTIVYHHQVEQIKQGKSLSETMPQGSAEAFVIIFDVVGSSKLASSQARPFMARVFQDCYQHMMENYNGKDLRANAYRIKEVGDGFICSVGFPFACPSSNPASHSVNLAMKFRDIFRQHAQIWFKNQNIHCGIGVALGTLEGYYPETGTQVYDLFGRAIILAARYESMRNVLYTRLGLKGSTIVLQEAVYNQLGSEERLSFTRVDLASASIAVRDDEKATCLFFNLADQTSMTKLSS
jgi:class 3 adenylate cyclase